MKKILFYLLLFSSLLSFCQQKFYFYIEISDLSEAPNLNQKSDGTVNVTFKNSQINLLFQNYQVYKFERACLFCKDLNLFKTFEIECNNIQLMNDLKNNFSNIFVTAEQFAEPKNLYLPNDYNGLVPIATLPASGSSLEPKTLNLIGAQQVWDITRGNSNIIIGISEGGGINKNHEELAGKVVNGTATPSWHATAVAGCAAANTDNGIGIASIGFNCNLAQGSFNTITANRAKVINMSYGSPHIQTITNPTPSVTTQNIINDLSDNSNITFVAAAGNGMGGNVSTSFLTANGLPINAENYAIQKHFPASYRNVISVSTVGNWNLPNTTVEAFDNWVDIHKIKLASGYNYPNTSIPIVETFQFHQHNDSIDIVVPSYRLPMISDGYSGGNNSAYFDTGPWGIGGTSFSSPIVAGTVGLMQSVNFCLKPKEVDSILKLTAVNIEILPENFEFHGKLGGGRLDAFKAVEMANEMAKPTGTVNVINRILYRNWFYKLETAPFEIKMDNNLITDESKIKFWARNNIEIWSGDYKPISGYVDLQINTNLQINNCITNINPIEIRNSNDIINENLKTRTEKIFNLEPNPNDGHFRISSKLEVFENIKIEIYDFLGKLVHFKETNSKNININLEGFLSGIYIVKMTSNDVSEVLQLIKE